MAEFNKMSITHSGMKLYTKAQAGTPIVFTKMRVGSGKLESDMESVEFIDLIDGKLDATLLSISPNTEQRTATIVAKVNNSTLEQGLYICELGLYANDPDEGEILYAYANSGELGDYYAPISQGPYTWHYQIATSVGNAANLDIELTELNYDYGLINSNESLEIIRGVNQKDINKNIDFNIKKFKLELDEKADKITVSQLERDMLRIKVQLEIDNRAPNSNGAFFDVLDGSDSRNIKLDTTKADVTERLVAGTLNIKVSSVEGFKKFTEVTICDDVNIEDVSIVSIDEIEKILTVNKLDNNYKKGAVVARSTIDIDVETQEMDVDSWGTFDLEEVV